MSEEIAESLREISTPTGLSYSGDRTLNNSYTEKIIDYINSLQQKVEQLENIRKEAIEFMKENCDIITIDKGWIIRSELTTTGLGKLFKILNEGDEDNV